MYTLYIYIRNIPQLIQDGNVEAISLRNNRVTPNYTQTVKPKSYTLNLKSQTENPIKKNYKVGGPSI